MTHAAEAQLAQLATLAGAAASLLDDSRGLASSDQDARDRLLQRVRELQTHPVWAHLTDAALKIDGRAISPAEETDELAAAKSEREELRNAVSSQKRHLKEQIDTLRQLMYEMQCMGMDMREDTTPPEATSSM